MISPEQKDELLQRLDDITNTHVAAGVRIADLAGVVMELVESAAMTHVIVGDGDVLAVKIPADTTHDAIGAHLDILTERFGDRFMLFAGDVEVAVMKGERE